MQKVLEENPQATQVVLLFGGNDCEAKHHIDEIIQQYDLMIDVIKMCLGNDCCIIMSSIPQRRRCSTMTHLKIAALNQHIASLHNPHHNLHYVDAAPRFGHQMRDRVHMNYQGMSDWAEKIGKVLDFTSNFQVTGIEMNQSN